MREQVSFNINAELYEDQFGDLAIRLPGDYVYCNVGEQLGDDFLHYAVQAVTGELPSGWHVMAPHELIYGKGWHRITSMGFINGEVETPGVEFETDPTSFGAKAQRYLGGVLPARTRH